MILNKREENFPLQLTIACQGKFFFSLYLQRTLGNFQSRVILAIFYNTKYCSIKLVIGKTYMAPDRQSFLGMRLSAAEVRLISDAFTT